MKPLLNWIEALRIKEVALMSGFFIIGSFFAITAFDAKCIILLGGLIVLSFNIVMSVYSFNAASGIEQDKYNLRLKNLWNFSKNRFLFLSVVFLMLSLIIGYFLRGPSVFFIIIIIFLWILYSHPKYGLKQKAIYGTLIHFIAQILHFLMAWMMFNDFKVEALYISLFFAIAFSSGHLLHEIMDAEADRKSGFSTSPIKFGVYKTSLVLITLLIANSLLWIVLCYFKIIDVKAFLSFFPASLIHAVLIVVYFNKIADKSILIRKVYRISYFLGGITNFVLIILK